MNMELHPLSAAVCSSVSCVFSRRNKLVSLSLVVVVVVVVVAGGSQVGTRVCVEKGHHVTVASVKRSARGSNFVDPYTEEEVDARYRLMLKPEEVREGER